MSNRGDLFRISIALAAIAVGACGAGDTRLDPSDLELRDLLGVAPEVARSWDAEQRAAARRVIAGGFTETDEPRRIALANGHDVEERVARTLVTLDARRRAVGADAVGVVRVSVGASELATAGRPAKLAAAIAKGADAPAIELWISEYWDNEKTWGQLPGRGLDLLAGLAADAGHVSGPVVIVPGARLPVAASYIEPRTGEQARLVVNPVLLAALEPNANEEELVASLGRVPIGGTAVAAAPFVVPAGVGAVGVVGGDVPGMISTDPTIVVVEPSEDPLARRSATGTGAVDVPTRTVDRNDIGNPYSFYGSLGECAVALQSRCERCMADSSCDPITATGDGNFECQKFAEDNGRGYFLMCANLSVTIASVDRCVGDRAGGTCPRDYTAANNLTLLANNAVFVDDANCGSTLDACLADIYGAPDPDNGPRRLDVSCGDSCESNNCEASPSCNCEGPSCNNSFSCDSACASSNDDSNCSSCNDSGGGSGGGGGGCNDSSSSGGSSGGSCGSCDDSGGSSGGCSGGCDSSSSDSGGGGCDSGCDSSSSSGGGGGGCGGGCDSSSSSGGGGGGCSGGGCGGNSSSSSSSGCSGGGGGGCQVAAAARNPGVGVTLAVSAMWGLMPVFAALLVKRRSRRRKAATASNASDVPDVATAAVADAAAADGDPASEDETIDDVSATEEEAP